MSYSMRLLSLSRAPFVFVVTALLMGEISRSDAAVLYSVRSIATSQTSGNILNGDYHSTDTGVVMAHSISAGPVTASSGGPLYGFTATSDVLTEVGKIHGSTTVSASSSGPAGGGNADVQGFWTDSMTVTSDTLANGTHVDFLATIILHSSVSGTLPQSHAYALLNGPFGLNITNDLSAPQEELMASTIISTTVGSTISLNSTLTLHADASGIAPFNLTASVLAENTAFFQLQAITAGASYSTASGALYVPEASSIVMLSSFAIAALSVMSRRRRRRRVDCQTA